VNYLNVLTNKNQSFYTKLENNIFNDKLNKNNNLIYLKINYLLNILQNNTILLLEFHIFSIAIIFDTNKHPLYHFDNKKTTIEEFPYGIICVSEEKLFIKLYI
jgi:hypothetical protein